MNSLRNLTRILIQQGRVRKPRFPSLMWKAGWLFISFILRSKCAANTFLQRQLVELENEPISTNSTFDVSMRIPRCLI